MPLKFSGVAVDADTLATMRDNLPATLDSYVNVGDEISVFDGEHGPDDARFVAVVRHREPFTVGVPSLGLTGSTAYIDDGTSTFRARVEQRGVLLIAIVAQTHAEDRELLLAP